MGTEFVVVLPSVLLVLLLAWEFSYFWWSRMVVSTATFEAAPTVAMGGTATKIGGPESTGMGLLLGCRHEMDCFEFSVVPELETAWLSRISEDRWQVLEEPHTRGPHAGQRPGVSVVGLDHTIPLIRVVILGDPRDNNRPLRTGHVGSSNPPCCTVR